MFIANILLAVRAELAFHLARVFVDSLTGAFTTTSCSCYFLVQPE